MKKILLSYSLRYFEKFMLKVDLFWYSQNFLHFLRKKIFPPTKYRFRLEIFEPMNQPTVTMQLLEM